MGRNERILGVQFQGKFGKWVKRAFFCTQSRHRATFNMENKKRGGRTLLKSEGSKVTMNALLIIAMNATIHVSKF